MKNINEEERKMRKRLCLTLASIISFMVWSSSIAQISVADVDLGNIPLESIKSIVTVSDALGNLTTHINTIQATGSSAKPLSWSGHLALDGLDDYAMTADHPELDLGDQSNESFTVEAWVNFDTFGPSDIVYKIDTYALYTSYSSVSGTQFRGLGFWLAPGRIVHVAITQWGGTGFWIPGWHHVAGVFNQSNGEMLLYMDGEQQHSWISGDQFVTNTNESVEVGVELAGKIEEVRISSTMRYTGPTYTIPNDPFVNDGNTRALWHFDEPNGSTQCHDAAGTDNVLTCHNGARVERETLVDHSALNIPEECALFQNYPNPFNPETTIKYRLHVPSRVALKIYDVTGDLVKTLIDETQIAGDYSIRWAGKDHVGKNVASGVYFCRFTANNFVKTMKMLRIQ